MAALGEEFTLCGLLSGSERRRRQDGLQGVEETGEEDAVLVTDGGRTVTVYKVTNQRPRGSWAVKQGQRITCPAVYNHRTGEYVLVHDAKVLRVWSDDDISLDKVFKATLSAEVSRIHSVPSAEPIVLFTGGALRCLDALLTDPQQEIETNVTEGEAIIWSQACDHGRQPALLFITEKDSDHFVYAWCPEFSAPQRWRLPLPADGSTVLDYSVVKKGLLFLAILYSSGHVCYTEVPLVPCDQAAEPLLLVSPLLQLPEPADTGALIILHDCYIATLTPCAAQQKDRLCIWNTSFQTLQDHKEFSQKTWTQLWAHDGKLYLPHANSMLVLPYTCEPSSLAAVMGKGRESLKSAPRATPVVNWETLVIQPVQQKPAVTKKSPKAKKPGSSREEPSYLPILSDVQTSTESRIPSLVKLLLKTTKQMHLQIAISSFTSRLAARCSSDPSFYPQSSVIRLLETGMLSYSLCPELMDLCLEKQDVQALCLCLEHFVDIPESVLCSCLKLFLSVHEDVLNKAAIGTKSVKSLIAESAPREETMELDPAEVLQNGFSSPVTEEDSCEAHTPDKMAATQEPRTSPVSQRRAVLINSILVSRYSETYLLPHLKDLPSELVFLLLSYLLYLHKKCQENATLNLPEEERLSVTQILDWMNLMIDANFTVLVLMPQARPLLRAMHKTIKLEMKLISEMNLINGSLTEFKKLQNPEQSSGRYWIEVLELY